MLNMKGLISNQKGVVLITALWSLVLITLLGTAAQIMTATDLKITRNYKTSAQAFNIAEAGVQRALGNINEDLNWISTLSTPTTDAFPGNNAFGKGSHVVQIFEDDPSPGRIRIVSTGAVTANNSSSVVEAVLLPGMLEILDYANFGCGNLLLKSGVTNIIDGGDIFASGNIILEPTGHHELLNGDVSVMGNLKIQGDSLIAGGNAFANNNIDVTSSALPNIDGNATSGSNMVGSGLVTGTSTSGAPTPVTNLCSGANLADITVTSDKIQDYRDNADTTIAGDLTIPPGGTLGFTGVVHVTGNFKVLGSATFSGNTTLVIDGNSEIWGGLTSSPAGSIINLFVPTGNFDIKGGGNVTIDGRLIVGSVNPDGSNITGGNINVISGSNLTVNGSAIAVNGNLIATAGGELTINYTEIYDEAWAQPGTYSIVQWREN